MAERLTGFEAEFERWKEGSFGPYCMTKCSRTCCDMSNVSLQVNAVELKTLFGRDVLNGDLREMGVKTVVEGKRYSVETKNPCVKFDVRTGRCLDYARRPSSCREFPFLVEQKALVIKSGCPISGKDPEYRKLAKITSSYGMVIVVRSGR